MRSPNEREQIIPALSVQTLPVANRVHRAVHARSFEHDIKMFTDKPDICIRQSRTVLIPIASSFLLIRRPIPRLHPRGEQTLIYAGVPDLIIHHPTRLPLPFFCRMIGKLTSVLVWAIPTPTVRWVRCSTLREFLCQNQSDRDNYAHRSDAECLINAVNLDAGR